MKVENVTLLCQLKAEKMLTDLLKKVKRKELQRKNETLTKGETVEYKNTML
jgi:hypothetical protein